MLLVQKWPFYLLSFFRHVSREILFYDILEQKNAFLRHKKRGLKRPKIDIFQKGLTHRFDPKMANFTTFFF